MRETPNVSDLFPGWTVCQDVRPAEWLRTALAPFPTGSPLLVDSLVPAAYPAHARILHPAYDASGECRVLLRDIELPQLRRWEGDPRFARSAGDWPFQRGGPWDYQTPTIGSLDPLDSGVLSEILAGHTTGSASVWALMWSGWGWNLDSLSQPLPLVRASRTWERYLLLRGELADVSRLVRGCGQAPSFWWPNDRAWVVGADLDTFSTYVAAGAQAIDEIVSDQRVEAYPAMPDDSCFPVPFLPYLA